MNEIRYIFCITTGRSGSRYLTTLLSHVNNCQSFHEPEPRGDGRIMRRHLRGDSRKMQKLTQEKVRKIKELTENGKTYVETHNTFIKGWGWFITDYLPEEQIGVIVLTREKEKIVKSMLRIGASPIRMFGRSWIATPEKKNPLIPPPNLVISPKFTYILMRAISFPLRVARKIIRLKSDADLTLRFIRDYELRCLHWYVDETMAESEKYMELHPKIMFYKVDVSQLNNYQAVVAMLDYFGLKAKDSIRNVIGKPVNLKLDENQ